MSRIADEVAKMLEAENETAEDKPLSNLSEEDVKRVADAVVAYLTANEHNEQNTAEDNGEEDVKEEE